MPKAKEKNEAKNFIDVHSPELKAVREEFKKDFMFYTRHCFTLEFDFSPAHYFMKDVLIDMFKRLENLIVQLEIARGQGKSTFFHGPIATYLTLCQGIQYIVQVSKTKKQARAFLRTTKNVLLSDKIRKRFGDFYYEYNDSDGILYVESKELKLSFWIEAKGITDDQFSGSSRSVFDKDWNPVTVRPQLVLADDMNVSETDQGQSDEVVSDLVLKFFTGINEFFDNKFPIGTLIAGTPFDGPCFYTEMEKYSNVLTYKIPALNVASNHEEITKLLGVPEGHAIWEANPNQNTKVLTKKYEECLKDGGEKLQAFVSQKLIEPKLYVSANGMKPGVLNFINIDDNIIRQCYWNIFIDGAFPKQSNIQKNVKTDDVGIALVGKGPCNTYFIKDVCYGMFLPDVIADKLENMIKFYGFNDRNRDRFGWVCIESSAFETIKKDLNQTLRPRGLWITYYELLTHGESKVNRMSQLIIPANRGSVYIDTSITKGKYKGLIERMYRIGPKSISDMNIVDAIAYSVRDDFRTNNSGELFLEEKKISSVSELENIRKFIKNPILHNNRLILPEKYATLNDYIIRRTTNGKKCYAR